MMPDMSTRCARQTCAPDVPVSPLRRAFPLVSPCATPDKTVEPPCLYPCLRTGAPSPRRYVADCFMAAWAARIVCVSPRAVSPQPGRPESVAVTHRPPFALAVPCCLPHGKKTPATVSWPRRCSPCTGVSRGWVRPLHGCLPPWRGRGVRPPTSGRWND